MPLKIQTALTEQNPIRALSVTAQQILANVDGRSSLTLENRGVIQLQLGNPRFIESQSISKSMQLAIAERTQGLGYDSHFGTDEDRASVAKILERLYALPGQNLKLNATNVFMTNGATLGINAAISASKSEANDPKGVVLVSRPGYPPYERIIRLHGLDVGYYDLKAKDGYFLSYEEIRKTILALGPQNIRLLIHNYPHNPTGATPSKIDAQRMAEAISRLSDEFPNIIFVEETLYHATINITAELWASYPFLSGEAKSRTIIIGSGSKLGLAGPRAGFIYSSNSILAQACGNYLSLSTAGTGYISHAGLIAVMKEMDLHQGQIINESSNPRGHISSFLQERIRILADGLGKLALYHGINSENLISTVPSGGMFLWVNFAPLFLARSVPKEIRRHIGKDKFETAQDLMVALLLMNLFKERSLLIAPGHLFAEQAPLYARLSCVTPDIKDLYAAIRSISLLAELAQEERGQAPFSIENGACP